MSQSIRLLAIDLRRTAPVLRESLIMNVRELEALVRRARSETPDVELVIVATSDRLELYSSEPTHEAAFRCVLRELVQRAGSSSALGEIPTVEATGVSAARHLLRLGAGIAGPSGLDILAALNLALARSRAAGTLGPELSALFATAVETGWRAYCETSVGDPTRSEPEREIAALEAERIVEEEVVAWKAKRRSGVWPRRAASTTSFYERYGTPSTPRRHSPAA